MKKNANTTPNTRNSTISRNSKENCTLFRAPKFYFTDDISPSRTIGTLYVFIIISMYLYFICGTLNREQECLNHLGDRTTNKSYKTLWRETIEK